MSNGKQPDTQREANQMEYNADEVTGLHNRISELETQLNNKEQALELQLKYNREKQAKIDRLDEWLSENWDNLDDTAHELAEMFDLSLTQTRTLTLTISAEVTLELPRGYDIDNISTYDFDLELNYSGDGELTWSDVAVEDVNE